MVVVIRVYNHVAPTVVQVFEKDDLQTIEDAKVMAEIYHRRDGGDYRVMVERRKKSSDEDILQSIRE